MGFFFFFFGDHDKDYIPKEVLKDEVCKQFVRMGGSFPLIFERLCDRKYKPSESHKPEVLSEISDLMTAAFEVAEEVVAAGGVDTNRLEYKLTSKFPHKEIQMIMGVVYCLLLTNYKDVPFAAQMATRIYETYKRQAYSQFYVCANLIETIRKKNVELNPVRSLDDIDRENEIIAERKPLFAEFMLKMGLSGTTVRDYANQLDHERLQPYLAKLVPHHSFYAFNRDVEVLELLTQLKDYPNYDRLRNALSKYMAFQLHALPQLPPKPQPQQEEKNEVRDKGVAFAEMVEVAMHATIIETYNELVMDALRENGKMNPNLNFCRTKDYWNAEMKSAIDYLLSPDNETLNQHFMEFFREPHCIDGLRLMHTIMWNNAGGENGWRFWKTLVRWKMMERIHEFFYQWDDFYKEWVPSGSFDEKEALELSYIERDFSVYTKAEIKACYERARVIVLESTEEISMSQEVTPLNIKTRLDARLKQKMIKIRNEVETSNAINEYESDGASQVDTHELDRVAMGNLFTNCELNNLKDTIKSLEAELKSVQKERDEANKKLTKAEAKIADYEKVESERKPIEHNQLVGDIFSEIAQRYMECTKNKDVAGRKEVKRNLRDIMDELKLHSHISRDIQRCISHFDDKEPPVIPQIIVQEVVLEKHVDYQVNGVEAGATGISVNHKPKKQ